jgi:hypothetical protein
MSSTNKFEELKKLGELLQAGVVSQEEFDAEKTRLMAGEEVAPSNVEVAKELYVPGTAPRNAELPANDLMSSTSQWNFQKIAIVVVRVWLVFATLGISEVLIFGYKKIKTSRNVAE